MERYRSVLALLLIVVLTVTALPVGVRAAEYEIKEQTETSKEVFRSENEEETDAVKESAEDIIISSEAVFEEEEGRADTVNSGSEEAKSNNEQKEDLQKEQEQITPKQEDEKPELAEDISEEEPLQDEETSENEGRKQDDLDENGDSFAGTEEMLKEVPEEQETAGEKLIQMDSPNIVGEDISQSMEEMLVDEDYTELLPVYEKVAEGVIEEDYGHVTWSIDKNGRLTVSGQGDISDRDNGYWAPWYSKRESIISAEVTVTGMTDASVLFADCYKMTSVDMNRFDTSQVRDMGSMFSGCSSLTSLDMSRFDTSQVRDMGSMFSGCSSLTSLDMSRFDTSQVTSMEAMFDGCSSLALLDVSGFDTSQVTKMDNMFGDCSRLATLDVSGFNTSRVTEMYGMFRNCSRLTLLDVSGIDTSQVRDMSGMFSGCSSLTSLDVSGIDTGQVRGMDRMFNGCGSLTSLDVSGIDTGQVMYMREMFKNCSSLTELNLGNFDMSYIESAEGMLEGCTGLTKIQTPYNVKVSVALPAKWKTSWKAPDGRVFTDFALNRGYSLVITLETDISSAKVSLTADSFEYTGFAIKPEVSVTYNGKMLKEGTDYRLSYTSNINSGIGIVMITGSGSYAGTLTGTFTITPKKFDQMDVSSVSSQKYTGKEITPSVIVKDGGKTLIIGTDYTVSYSNNIQLGTADIVITGTGNYTGERTVHFMITEQKPTDSDKADTPIQSEKPEEGDEYTCKNVLYKVLSFTDTEGTVEAMSATKKSIKSVNVPDTLEINGYSFLVVSVKSSAFAGCTKMKTVKLGKNITSIGKKAFKDCAALTSINIPTGVTKLEDNTFNGCKKLKTVSGCDGITSVGSKAFYKCEKLVTVGSRSRVLTLKKVKTIGSSAFYGCKSVKKVNLTSTALTKIGASAFYNCISVTSFISKSKKLASIGKNAFNGNRKLGTISLETEKLKKSKVGSNAFKGIKSTCKFKVPKKQVSTYKEIFKAKGAGNRFKVSKL